MSERLFAYSSSVCMELSPAAVAAADTPFQCRLLLLLLPSFILFYHYLLLFIFFLFDLVFFYR